MTTNKLLVNFFFTFLCTISCARNEIPGPGGEEEGGGKEPPIEIPEGYIADTSSIASLWKDKFACGAFASAQDVEMLRWLVNGQVVSSYDKSLIKANNDLRYEFVGKDSVRFVSESDGYALSLPKSAGLKADYTLAKYAQKFENEDISIRVTLEKVDPYPATEYYYGIYTGEWLDRYISNSKYITQNNMLSLDPMVKGDESIIEGYSVNIYSINAVGLDKPYYKIALVRPLGQWSKFGFLLFKANSLEHYKSFDDILKSFRIFSSTGTSKNFLPSQQALPNPKWNSETKAYYRKLLDQKTFDFGVFTYSMPGDNDETMQSQGDKIQAEKDRLEAVFGKPYDIMPTYTHIAWYDFTMEFPCTLADRLAGGNGFNSKPVLQFTYQFTTNNNNVSAANTSSNRTPMFDILRGKYDGQFRKLAQDIKAYSHPVLFRLNNEMNSDWTSYCGMITLCDPEIFIQTWRYLYEIFEQEGVDNCIWIFNPIAQSCPYSKWGENLAYYPGNEYVQALGVTNYEMGNNLPFTSFRDRYTAVYNTNRAIFSEMPWIISEFACGSGGATSGEEMRNQSAQAEWVRGMFQDFLDYDSHPYLHPLKGGVWFSANDYSGEQTTNYLRLDASLEETLAAFTWGFSEMYGLH